ncbi:hypothetical protein HZA33_02080 [Candidatus Pacearchaeota archaeon]|nr:hypothetical protein [Candidatus Pacearchaeota archaeon]
MEDTNKKTKKRYVKICPQCKSLEVRTNFKAAQIAIGAPTDYSCEQCGFTSVIFPEIETEAEMDKEQIKEEIGKEINKEANTQAVEVQGEKVKKTRKRKDKSL